MLRTFISFGIISGIILILFSIFSTYIDSQLTSLNIFISIMLTITIVGPLVLYLILNFSLTKKTIISLNKESIIIQDNLSISYQEIRKIKKVVNYNGFSSLLILFMKNGKKFSLAPINKFSKSSLEMFHVLGHEIEYYVEMNKIK